MIQNFDIFNLPEQPELTLCNPSGDEIYSLKGAYNKTIRLRFNALSEFQFTYPSKVDGETLPAYSSIVSKRTVLIENYGYFLITNVEKVEDGASETKNVTCTSIDGELIYKKVTVFGGTYKLWDILEPSTTLLGKMLLLAPSWSVLYVDPLLLEKYRTFDVSDTNVYGFLSTEVSQAYGCIFDFNYTTKQISAYSVENATSSSSVFLSFDNLIQNSTFREISDELCTALLVYGAGDLDIATVNPLGTNYMYNFDYFKDSEWMSAGLISALDAWETLVDTLQPEYGGYLAQVKTLNGELIVLEGELDTLEAEYLALEGVQKVRIEAGLDYSDILESMGLKSNEIAFKQAQIDSKEDEISATITLLQSINESLSFSVNFTESQISELSNFVYENTYQNENLVQTDSMTAEEIQEQAQTLYDQAQTVLAKVSVPRYEFDMNIANFVQLKDFQSFTSSIELGSEVLVEISDGTTFTVVLLEMSFTFDDPNNFSATFSNRLRLDNGMFSYADIFGKNSRVGSTVSFDALKWGNWENEYKNDVTTFITSALDASLNEIVNASNQEIVINQNGLRGRTYVPETGLYEDFQVWLTSKTLAFTRDGWDTASLAIGRIDHNGSYVYGVVADAIIGTLLAGNTLRIENDANNFVLDETGATLNNASFTINSNDGKSRLYLNADDGIRIETQIDGTWSDKFYVDTSGNVVFSGDLTGATGNFSGEINASVGNIGTLVIDNLGLKTSDGVNYLRGDGTLRWGGLNITATTATFSGTIYADKLVGQIDTPQIASGAVTNEIVASGLNAGKVTAGSMSGSRIYGGSIGGPGMSIDLSSTGVTTLTANSALQLQVGGKGVYISSGLGIFGSNNTYLGLSGGYTNIQGSLYINGTAGYTTNFVVGGAYSAKRLYFTNGIFTGWSFS